MAFLRRVFLQLATPAIALVALTSITCAQDWPTRPVTMVVPFAAGGATDVLARVLGAQLSELLGQQIIVENIGGAGGMTGSARVAKAPPDGYQFVLGSTGTHAANQTLYKHPLYNAMTDFTPVMLVVEQPIALITRKDLPARNLAEFIAYAKTNQAKMHYGSPGAGAMVQLACAMLNAAIGIDVTHVPYRGGVPAIQDLLGGRIDYYCGVSTTAIPLIAGNQVNAIALLTRNRSPSLPALATAHEQGLADFDTPIWYAIFLPKNTPSAIVQKLHAAAVAAVDIPAVRRRLQEIGADVPPPERRSPAYLQRFVESEVKKLATAIKAAGLAEQ